MRACACDESEKLILYSIALFRRESSLLNLSVKHRLYLVMRFAGQRHSTKTPGRTLARMPNSIPAHTHVSSVSMRKMVGLLHLPPELHDMILQSAGFRDLVALEYTSRYFAALCRRHWKTAKPSKKDLCWAARRGNLKVLRKVLQMLKPIDPKKMFPTHYEPYAGGSGLLYQAIYCYDASVKSSYTPSSRRKARFRA